MATQKTVLCIQDGTDLNYSRLVQCEGLEVIGTNQTGAQSTGLHLHSTFVVSTEGLPLGVLGGTVYGATVQSERRQQTGHARADRGEENISPGSLGCARASSWPPSCPIHDRCA